MKRQRAVLFVNGNLVCPDRVRSMLCTDDFLVAVDGGLRHLVTLGLKPHLLIGDFDSVAPDALMHLESAGVMLKRHPVEKDETDLELALQYVVAEGYREVLIVAALGGRLDQILGNVFLLMSPSLEGCRVRLVDGHEEVFLIRACETIYGRAGDVVSLLPLQGVAEGVTTEGLQYPLRQETLHPARTRGISNVMLGERAVISLRKGLLLCVHTEVC
ncbi:MAG: thiamine diphosphokinase [Anaerolineae bacterium]|nr:thiamine diphosphokinase [Anaerolineae bacterium]